MDRLKSVLAVLKRHHFWVLCGAAVLIGLGLWWVATASVDKQRAKRTTAIEAELQSLAQIASDPAHPNQQTIAAFNSQTEELKRKVLEAWIQLYAQQKEKNPLPNVLSPEFKLVFDSLERQPDIEIDGEKLDEYRNFIRRHIDTLPEMVDCLRPAPVTEEAGNPDAPDSARQPTGAADVAVNPGVAAAGAVAYDGPTPQVSPYPTGAGGESAQYGPKIIGVVDWAQPDRQQLEQRFYWQTRPTTEQVRLAQEDLWVYEALLRIIKNTNGPVKNRSDAAIKGIQALQIGRDASMAWQAPGGGAAYSYGSGGGTGAVAPKAYDPVAEQRSGSPGLSPSPGPAPTTGAADAYAAPLAEGRYVDKDLQPVEASRDLPFNLMPIRMVLVMNQTKLARLLVECGNSSMPVEVRSVFLGTDGGNSLNMALPVQPGRGSGSPVYRPSGTGYDGRSSSSYDGPTGYGPASYGPPRGAGYGSSGGHGPGPEFQPGGSYRPSGVYGPAGAYGPGGLAQKGRLDVPVEIRGTICIYNPPNEDKLKTAAAAKTPPETPAATPPTETPPATLEPTETHPGTPAPTVTPPATPAPTVPPPATPPSGGPPGGTPPAGGQPSTTGQS